MPRRAPHLAWIGAALALAACARSERTVDLIAAFSNDSRLGTVTAHWEGTGAAHGGRRALRYRLDLDNQLAEGLFVRLGGFRLTGVDELAPDGASVACIAPPGRTADVLAGLLWLDGEQWDDIDSFEVERFALPLSDRGRAFYREFKLRQLPGQEAAIDAEIAAAAAAPPCGVR
ncbi:MAG: hypothetical protein ACRERC_22025 [Candidatus Binatia bacterium]